MDEEEAKHRAAGLLFVIASALWFAMLLDTGIDSVGTTSIGIGVILGLVGVGGLAEPRLGQILFHLLDHGEQEESDSRSDNEQVIKVEGDNNTIESNNASK